VVVVVVVVVVGWAAGVAVGDWRDSRVRVGGACLPRGAG